MSDEPQAPATPPEGDAPATPSPPAGEATPPTPAPERTYTAAEFREVQSEARNLRARLRAAEEAAAPLAPALEAARGEADALRSQVASLTERLRAYELRDAIAAAAREEEGLQSLDAELAARLVEGVEYEAGAFKGLSAALKRLVKKYPQLAPAPRVPAQPAAGGQPGAPAVDLSELAAAKRRQVGAL